MDLARYAAVMVSLTLAMLAVAWWADGQDESTTADAIQRIQPAVTEERAKRLGLVFDEAGRETGTDPLLLVAMAMRESSFSLAIEEGRRMGQRGERGLLQIRPTSPALAMRPEGCTEELEGARCQVLTGARWLAYVREECPGTHWRWVAAYGMSRCPTEEIGGMHQSTRTARRYYLAVGGVLWP